MKRLLFGLVIVVVLQLGYALICTKCDEFDDAKPPQNKICKKWGTTECDKNTKFCATWNIKFTNGTGYQTRNCKSFACDTLKNTTYGKNASISCTFCDTDLCNQDEPSCGTTPAKMSVVPIIVLSLVPLFK